MEQRRVAPLLAASGERRRDAFSLPLAVRAMLVTSKKRDGNEAVREENEKRREGEEDEENLSSLPLTTLSELELCTASPHAGLLQPDDTQQHVLTTLTAGTGPATHATRSSSTRNSASHTTATTASTANVHCDLPRAAASLHLCRVAHHHSRLVHCWRLYRTLRPLLYSAAMVSRRPHLRLLALLASQLVRLLTLVLAVRLLCLRVS